jgi:hypothetical protein
MQGDRAAFAAEVAARDTARQRSGSAGVPWHLHQLTRKQRAALVAAREE